MEYGPNPDMEEVDEESISHWHHRVAKQSRRPPPILSVNREARYEALKVYKITMFDTPTKNNLQRPVYFRPGHDIVYFGKRSCRGLIVKFSEFALQNRLSISRLAMQVADLQKFSVSLHNCSFESYTWYSRAHGWPSSWHEDLGIMDVLHGTPSLYFHRGRPPTTAPGFGDLDEVYLVVASNLWSDQTEVGSGFDFRETVGHGHTEYMAQCREDISEKIQNIEEDGGLLFFGDNKWANGRMPRFRFVHPAPMLVGSSLKVYDSMVMSPGYVASNRKQT